MISNRIAFGDEVYNLALTNPRIAVVDSDCIVCLYYEKFIKAFPERFVQCGISEQDQFSIASGIASCGMTVFAGTFAVFTASRALDQVRNMICYNNFDVKTIGTHAGLETGFDGGTHQSLEDIAVMRAIPDMRVLVPSTPEMTRKLTRVMAETPGPMYMRFGRDQAPELYDESAEFSLGGSVVAREGKDVAILACGSMVNTALKAAKKLSGDGIEARVVDMYSIKPIDSAAIESAARDIGIILTLEDHSVIGGLGGAVCEYTAQNCPVKVSVMGVNDAFGRSGTPEALFKLYGLDEESVIKRVKGLL